jgi:hypothetical protein
LAEEAFASVSLHEKRLVFIPKFIPEIVEVGVVGSEDYVG